MEIDAEVLILGAGVAGLSAAAELGSRAIVLERSARPGGLVRTDSYNCYWFDHVVHQLYFADPDTAARVRGLMGSDLQPCETEAWVVTAEGTVRYPLQTHLRGLNPEATVRCVADFVRAAQNDAKRPGSLEEAFLMTFGRSMCEVFLFPYNRKVWKRPLHAISPHGLWTVTQPDLDDVLRGAILNDSGFRPYNTDAWYPRPEPGASLRGMELLSRALASAVCDIRLRHEVRSIDLDRHIVTAASPAGSIPFRYDRLCSTIPLPQLISMATPVPPALVFRSAALPSVRVVSVFVSVRGPRPPGTGHWRYYAEPSIIFTRLTFMHKFDPGMAPRDGWGVLVELTEDAAAPASDRQELLRTVAADLRRTVLDSTQEIVDMNMRTIEPAYVIFTAEACQTVADATAFLRDHDVEPLGRYGRWEYSSMAQVMQQGHAWARSLSRAACAGAGT